MLEDIISDRLKKLKNFEAAGVSPYPEKSSRTHTTLQVLENFDSFNSNPTTITGRLTGFRDQGGVFFADITDESGKLQIVGKKDNFENFELYQKNLDIGDFIEATGTTFITKKGEKSLEIKNLKLLTKSLRPLPDQWSGLEDIEIKLRQRYLDVLTDPAVKTIFYQKAKFWDVIRNTLKERGFLELEMPVLEPIPGGAEAEPFVTHHNALDTDFYLRISLELPLKKALIAGYEKVFEIGRIFRNEGIDAEHLQDYTQCEFYEAYSNYEELMTFVEGLYKKIVVAVTGEETTTLKDQTINWSGSWPRVTYKEIFEKYVGLDLDSTSEADLLKKAKAEKLNPEKGIGRGRLIDLLYKKLARPNIIQPTFLINPLVELEPLAKIKADEPSKVCRMQVIACGTELGKGFSELTDPVDQRARFEAQMKLREKGDKEAQMLDDEFLTALEFGMPPASGFGLSERLFAILINRPIRETVFFPPMKPRGN